MHAGGVVSICARKFAISLGDGRSPIPLVTALLIIPAATARRFTSTPETMAVLFVGFGSAASAIGLWAAYVFDWPAGPTMVATAAVFFGISQLRNAV